MTTDLSSQSTVAVMSPVAARGADGISSDEIWLAAVAKAAAKDAGVSADLLGEYLPMLAAATVAGQRPHPRDLGAVGALGRRAAEQGIPTSRVVNLYLSAAWRLWRALPKLSRAEDKETVQPGSVYFAPPDYHLLIERGALAQDPLGRPGPGGDDLAACGPTLALSSDEPVHFSRPSIDVLFESAADVYGERLLGLILTGANEDGVDGLAAVRLARGRTVVQDPRCAVMPLLPEAALSRGPVDFLLSLEQLQELFASCPAGR